MTPWTNDFMEIIDLTHRFARAYDDCVAPSMNIWRFADAHRKLLFARANLEMALAQYRVTLKRAKR